MAKSLSDAAAAAAPAHTQPAPAGPGARGRTVVPFGPQHPVLPEPIHLDLVLEDEKVVEAIPSIGFVHRGFEKLVEKMDYNEMVHIADRICGICAFIHSATYCQAIEEVMKVQIPDRARYLRTIWSELARLSSHLLWLGLMADAFGFESLFMQCFHLREKIVQLVEETTGSRIIFGVCKVGGVRRDVDAETLKRVVARVNVVAGEMREAADVFLRDASVMHRLVGVGVLSKEQAYELGCVGPVLRASGVNQDTRSLGYAAYREVGFEPVVGKSGDSYERCACRIGELFASVDIINRAAAAIPAGEVAVKVTGNPNGEFHSRCEQPRGEVVHYVKADGGKFLKRYRVRTPTFANLPALVKMLQGCELADVPVLVLTIDPCVSCTER
jgi:ech hydrogenase subunit E